MIKKRNIFYSNIPLLLFAILFSQLSAVLFEGLSEDSFGENLGYFATEAGISGESYAMALSHGAVGRDAAALYFNPAAIGLNGKVDLVTSYSLLGPGNSTGLGSLAFNFPYSDELTLGLVYQNIRLLDSINEYNAFGEATGASFSHRQNQLLFGLAYQIYSSQSIGNFYTGMNLRSVSFSLYDQQDLSIGMDYGLLYEARSWGFNLALILQNLPAPSLQFSGNEYTYPANLKLAYSSKHLNSRLLVSAKYGIIGFLNDEQIQQYSIGSLFEITPYLNYALGLSTQSINTGLGLSLYGNTLQYAAEVDSAGLQHHLSYQRLFGRTERQQESYLTEREAEVEYRELVLQLDRYLEEENFEKALAVGAQLRENRLNNGYRIENNLQEKLDQSERLLELQTLYELAQDFYDDEDYENAYATIRKIYTINPDYQKAMGLRDTVYNYVQVQENIAEIEGHIAEKNWLAADNVLQSSLELDSENSQLKELRAIVDPEVNKIVSEKLMEEATVFLKVEEYAKAESKINEALKKYPGNVEARQIRIDIVTQKTKDQYDTAFNLYKDARHNEATPIIEAILKTENEGKDFNQIINNARKLQKLNQAKIYLAEAQQHIENEDYAKAEESIKQALTLDATDPVIQETYERLKLIRSLE